MAKGSRRIWVQDLDGDRLARAKRSFTTRRVDLGCARTLVGGHVRPRAGDLVLARVARLGQHRRLELPDGRRATMHVDDEILVVFGDRYAPDQFEAEVPSRLGRAQLVASGGVAAKVVTKSLDVRSATDIVTVGLVGDNLGRPINTSSFALPRVTSRHEAPPTVAVVGTSMNSGKTTTIHHLVHSLARAGRRPGATKVTGTGSGGDYWVMLDAGAHVMLDFTDAGLVSTYRTTPAVVDSTFRHLLAHLTNAGSQVRLVEVADGIYQQETARLIDSAAFHDEVDLVVFAAGDAMGAANGVETLRSLGHEVVAVSGRLTRSPLAVRETEEATGLPVVGITELSDPRFACGLLGLDLPEPATEPGYPTVGEEIDDPIDSELIDLTSMVGARGVGAEDRLTDESTTLQVTDQR